ncbi:hypothetical protein Q1B88_000400 [Salmonella enterica]
MDTFGFDERYEFYPDLQSGFSGHVGNFRCNGVDTLNASLVNYNSVPDIDYSVLGNYWSLGFSSVLLLWLFSVGVGQVIKMVRNA